MYTIVKVLSCLDSNVDMHDEMNYSYGKYHYLDIFDNMQMRTIFIACLISISIEINLCGFVK